MPTLGEVIANLREEKGISVTKLERLADLSNPIIYQIEKGEGNPTLKTIEKIASAFDMSASELIAMADGKADSK